jgi:hypothetical protein
VSVAIQPVGSDHTCNEAAASPHIWLDVGLFHFAYREHNVSFVRRRDSTALRGVNPSWCSFDSAGKGEPEDEVDESFGQAHRFGRTRGCPY